MEEKHFKIRKILMSVASGVRKKRIFQERWDFGSKLDLPV